MSKMLCALFLCSYFSTFLPIFFKLCIDIGIGEEWYGIASGIISIRNNRVMPLIYVQNAFLVNILRMNRHLISSQSLNLGGRLGTTNDIATIPFHPSLSSAALRESPNSIPIHSLMLSSHLVFRLPLSFLLLSLSLAELSSPCQRILRCGHTI